MIVAYRSQAVQTQRVKGRESTYRWSYIKKENHALSMAHNIHVMQGNIYQRLTATLQQFKERDGSKDQLSRRVSVQADRLGVHVQIAISDNNGPYQVSVINRSFYTQDHDFLHFALFAPIRQWMKPMRLAQHPQ